MKPAPFRYERPETVEEAAALLAEHGDEAKVLAGGQSLLPVLNFRLLRPALLVDVNHVAGLDRLDGERVGATVRQRDFRGNALAEQALPFVGHYVTRNRGTVGEPPAGWIAAASRREGRVHRRDDNGAASGRA